VTELHLTQPATWGQCWAIDCEVDAQSFLRRDGVAVAVLCPEHTAVGERLARESTGYEHGYEFVRWERS
jgi:hypothetical protein